MDRGRSFRLRAWICWGAIVSSWLIAAAALHESLARLERAMAALDLDYPPVERRNPPAWLVALACVLTALFLGACLRRRFRARLRMRPRLSQPSVHGDLYLEAFALSVVLPRLGSGAFQFLGWTWVPLAQLSLIGFLAAIVHVLARCRSIRAPLSDWGWSLRRFAWLELLIGLGAGAILTHLLCVPRAGAESTSGTLLHAVALAPLLEETLHRGLLYRHLRDRLSWPVAVVIGSSVFAAGHLPINRWPYAFASGLVYSLLREWRGSLLAPIAAHATVNSLVVAVWS